MTQIYAHPYIDDNFVEYDFHAVTASAADGGSTDLRRSLMADYAGAKCILLRNVTIDYDRAFINKVNFPHTWAFKKFASSVVELREPLAESPAKQEMCRDLFGGDAGLYRIFEEQVRLVNNRLRAVLDEILKAYDVTGRDITWRHTETRVENLHFDVDRNSGDFESVRLYYNMDDVPRIWHTSHDLFRLMTYYYDRIGLAEFTEAPLEELLKNLSKRLFGNWTMRGREQFPHHMALFEPGDVWLADGRTIPHQVIYGRRVLSSFYRLAQDGLPDWHPPLSGLVAKIHADRAAGIATAPPAHDMRGFVFPFGVDGSSLPKGQKRDLKAEWADMYEHSIQQKLVRL